MTEGAFISVVALLGWLFLAGSALASFQLGWSKTVKMALLWLAIFVGLFVVVRLAGVN